MATDEEGPADGNEAWRAQCREERRRHREIQKQLIAKRVGWPETKGELRIKYQAAMAETRAARRQQARS